MFTQRYEKNITRENITTENTILSTSQVNEELSRLKNSQSK